jgi:hypothetical protein
LQQFSEKQGKEKLFYTEERLATEDDAWVRATRQRQHGEGQKRGFISRAREIEPRHARERIKMVASVLLYRV